LNKKCQKESQLGESTEEKLEIKEAYAKADERRRKEKRNRLIITIIAIVIILSIIFGIILI